MSRWRKGLFLATSRITADAAEDFGLSRDRTVIIGSRIEVQRRSSVCNCALRPHAWVAGRRGWNVKRRLLPALGGRYAEVKA